MYPKKITSTFTANLPFNAALLPNTQLHNKWQMSDTQETLTNQQHPPQYHPKIKPLKDPKDGVPQKQSKIIYKHVKGKEKEEKKRER